MGFFKKTVMTEEQEQFFLQTISQKTGKYFWAAAAFVLVFQIYNIFYALYYTGFRLESRSSRIYMCLYLSIALVCIVVMGLGIVWSYGRKVCYSRLLALYMIFGCALLLWSACLTLYDSRISDNLSIYMTSAIYVAGLFYMKPQISLPVYFLSEAVLLLGLLQMHLTGIQDHYGSCVNSIGIMLVGMFISLNRWESLRQEFLDHYEIEQKNREILEQSEKLNYMANHDALTGLWNRNYLKEWTEQFFQSPEEKWAEVFMADIDFFKQYNDVFGHVAGDECLRKIAGAMEEEQEGILFRYGGEEFLYLRIFPGECGEPRNAGKTAEQLRKCVEDLQIKAASPQKKVTVSVGYSQGRMQTEEEFRILLREADEALYSAKNAGRNKTVGYQDIKK